MPSCSHAAWMPPPVLMSMMLVCRALVQDLEVGAPGDGEPRRIVQEDRLAAVLAANDLPALAFDPLAQLGGHALDLVAGDHEGWRLGVELHAVRQRRLWLAQDISVHRRSDPASDVLGLRCRGRSRSAVDRAALTARESAYFRRMEGDC